MDKIKEIKDSKRDPIFWSCNEDEEYLTFTDIDDAIRDYVDNDSYPTPRDELPDEIEVYGFARHQLKRLEVPDMLSYCLETLDEDFVCEEDTEPSKAMIEAHDKLIDIIVRDYAPWTCDLVTVEKVDLKSWLAAEDGE